MKYVKLLLASIIATGLAACGGGGGGGGAVGSDTATTASSIGGIWDGVVTYSDSSQEGIVGIVTESGEGVFLSDDGGLTFGNISKSGTSFSGSFTGYAPSGSVFNANGQAVISGTIDGSFSERSRLNIRSFYQGTQASTSAYAYDRTYERPSSISKISNTYFYSEPGYSESITISSVGDISGSNSDGCVYSGSVSIIDSRFNVYDVSFSVANCGAYGGVFNGLATLVDDVNTDDLLIFAGENGGYAVAGYFWR